MRLQLHTSMIFVALGSVAAPAVAQVLPGRGAGDVVSAYIDPQAGLDLDAAVAHAVAAEPSLQAERLEIDAAAGRLTQAALRPNPMMAFERRVEPGGTDRVTGLSLDMPLDLRRRASRMAVADRDLDATRAAVADRERILAADVRRQVGLAAAAARDVEVVDALVETIEGQLELIRVAVDVGRTPPLERDVLEVEWRRLRAMRALTVGRAESAFIVLRRLLGMTPQTPLRLRDTIETLVGARSDPAPGPHDDRPDVREAVARVAAADAAITREARAGSVDASIFGGYMWMDAGFPQRAFGAGGQLERVRAQFQAVTGGIRITLPFFDRNQGLVASARAKHAAALARHDAVTLAAAAERAEADAREARAREALSAFDGGVRTLARQNLDVVRQSYELGRATVTDVLVEQRRLLELEQAYTETLREVWDAHVARRRARGE